jgi:hypothetical protein
MEAFESVLEQWTKFGWDKWKVAQQQRISEIESEETALVESRKSLVKQTKGYNPRVYL